MECVSDGFELPDVIGWMVNGTSWLIEVKTSRSDFLVDRKKAFRKEPSLGLGNFRWYATPPGLVKPEEMPLGWGLLEVHPKTIRILRKPSVFHLNVSSARREKALLVSGFRRATEGWGQKVVDVHRVIPEENEEIDDDEVSTSDLHTLYRDQCVSL